jgi:hypothetical protein
VPISHQISGVREKWGITAQRSSKSQVICRSANCMKLFLPVWLQFLLCKTSWLKFGSILGSSFRHLPASTEPRNQITQNPTATTHSHNDKQTKGRLRARALWKEGCLAKARAQAPHCKNEGPHEMHAIGCASVGVRIWLAVRSRHCPVRCLFGWASRFHYQPRCFSPRAAPYLSAFLFISYAPFLGKCKCY